MADIRSPRLLYLKGILFLGLGVLASVLLLVEHPDLRSALLLAISVWAFARAYYFAFYVIEHYVDPGFRYRGLVQFLTYLIRRSEIGQPGARRLSEPPNRLPGSSSHLDTPDHSPPPFDPHDRAAPCDR